MVNSISFQIKKTVSWWHVLVGGWLLRPPSSRPIPRALCMMVSQPPSQPGKRNATAGGIWWKEWKALGSHNTSPGWFEKQQRPGKIGAWRFYFPSKLRPEHHTSVPHDWRKPHADTGEWVQRSQLSSHCQVFNTRQLRIQLCKFPSRSMSLLWNRSGGWCSFDLFGCGTVPFQLVSHCLKPWCQNDASKIKNNQEHETRKIQTCGEHECDWSTIHGLVHSASWSCLPPKPSLSITSWVFGETRESPQWDFFETLPFRYLPRTPWFNGFVWLKLSKGKLWVCIFGTCEMWKLDVFFPLQKVDDFLSNTVRSSPPRFAPW